MYGYKVSRKHPLSNHWQMFECSFWHFWCYIYIYIHVTVVILKMGGGGYRLSFGCKRSCSRAWRLSHFYYTKVFQRGIYTHIKFERGRWHYFLIKCSSKSTGEHKHNDKYYPTTWARQNPLKASQIYGLHHQKYYKNYFMQFGLKKLHK